MKKVFFLLFLFFLNEVTLLSQNYSPFNAGVTKRFYNSNLIADNKYFFYADSIDVSGDTTILYQYFTAQAAMPALTLPPECFGWGGGGWTIADTTWLGNNILYNHLTSELLLKNEIGSDINFDFSLNLGDSSIFYQDSLNRYYIKYIQIQNESIYSTFDTIKTFSILHLDTNGTTIPSLLHLETIRLGKTLGLISFISINDFPAIEKAVTLQGQLYPKVGSYILTYEELYPFNIGDTLQYTGEINYDNYSMCTYLNSYVVTDRIETINDVTITFDQTIDWLYTVPPPYNSICVQYGPYFSSLHFLKSQDLIGQPHNMINYGSLFPPVSWSYVPESYYFDVNCNYDYSLFRNEMTEHYCDGCECLIGFDGAGSSYTDYSYTPGLGITYMYSWMYQPTNNYNTWALTYYNVNGISCGVSHSIGIEESNAIDLILSPNPSSGIVRTNIEFSSAKLFSIQGELLLNLSNPGNTIDLSSLPTSIYILELYIGNNKVIKKLVKSE